MIFLEHFKSGIPPAEAHHKLVQDAFLRHLFPESYPHYTPPDIGPGWRSHHEVALAGYLSAMGVQKAGNRFIEGLEWLKGLGNAPEDLPHNSMALLGLALGIRQMPPDAQQAQIQWLLRLPKSGTDMVGFLHHLLLGHAAPSISEEHRLGAAILTGTGADPQALASYLRAARKQHPLGLGDQFGPDFFRAMLSVRIMDEAMDLLIRGDALWQEPRRRAAATAARRADWITFGLALLWSIGLSLAGVAIFIATDQAAAHQGAWDSLKWALIFLGGPIPCLAYLARATFLLLRGQRPDWTLENIRARLQALLLRRILRRRGLPTAQD